MRRLQACVALRNEALLWNPWRYMRLQYVLSAAWRRLSIHAGWQQRCINKPCITMDETHSEDFLPPEEAICLQTVLVLIWLLIIVPGTNAERPSMPTATLTGCVFTVLLLPMRFRCPLSCQLLTCDTLLAAHNPCSIIIRGIGRDRVSERKRGRWQFFSKWAEGWGILFMP